MRIRTNIFFVLVIIFTATSIFCLDNYFFEGYMKNYESLGIEIWAPADSLHQWNLAEQAPYKYRFLFPAIVLKTWDFLPAQSNNSFYYIYCFWSLVFYLSTSVCFYFFLITLKFKEKTSFIGTLILLSLSPVFLAYSLPVHTREDTLAYTILLAGLIALFKEKYLLVALFSCLGVLCRETLLILPFVLLFYTNASKWYRVGIFALALSILISSRVIMGLEAYDMLGKSFLYNFRNVGVSLIFAFLTFEWLWPLFFSWVLKRNDNLDQNDNNSKKILLSSGIWVFVLIFATTLLGGRLNEMRILFLFFPWIIPISFWKIKEKKAAMIITLKSKSFKIYSIASIFICLTICLLTLKLWPRYFSPSQFNIAINIWIVMLSVKLFLLLLVLRLIIPTKNLHY